MRTGLVGNLALAALAAALALFLYLYPRAKPPSDYALSTLKPQSAGSIRIERAGVKPIVLERRDGTWFLVAPLQARADPFLVQRLLSIVEARASHRLAATELARFELERPEAQLTIDGQGFGFGMMSPVSREQYVLTGDAVYTVSPRYGTALPAGAEDLLSRQLFGPDEVPVHIELGDFAVAQRDGRWTLAPDAGGLSQDELGHWMDRWRLAVALRVEPYARGKPQGEIKVQLKNGTSLRLDILGRAPELVLARPDERLQYYFLAESAKRLLAPPGAARDERAQRSES